MPVALQRPFGENQSPTTSEFTHTRYQKAVKYALSHLSDAEAKITAAILDVLEVLKLKWRQTASQCIVDSTQGHHALENLITQISDLNPAGYLARHGRSTIDRRLRIAIVTSLLRHVRQPELLRKKFGRPSQILRKMGRNPALFSELMTIFQAQAPYARIVIPQTFWRTLTNMDYESPK